MILTGLVQSGSISVGIVHAVSDRFPNQSEYGFGIV